MTSADFANLKSALFAMQEQGMPMNTAAKIWEEARKTRVMPNLYFKLKD